MSVSSWEQDKARARYCEAWKYSMALLVGSHGHGVFGRTLESCGWLAEEPILDVANSFLEVVDRNARDAGPVRLR